MIGRSALGSAAMVGLLCLAGRQAPAQETGAGRPGGPKPPNISARLYTSHDAVNPGGQADLAIELTIDPGWHVYHRIVLDTGLPTTFKFDAPPNTSVGQVRFPAPELGETTGLEYLYYEGKPVFLAPLAVGKDVKPGQELTIAVKVSGLVCKEACLPFEASASLKLPVRERPGNPAHEKLFKEARAGLPPPLKEAAYIKGSRATVSQTKVRPGDSFELALEIEVEKGHHIQARDPGVEGLIPSRVFVQQIDGFEFKPGEQVWPEPKTVTMEGFGKVREYAGKVVIRQPVKFVDEKFPSGPVEFVILFQYQACTDAGMCFPPILAEGSARLEVVDAGPPAPVSSPLLAGRDVSPGTAASVADSGADEGVAAEAEAPSVFWVYFLAFLGGLILNVMPCVLPVISLKIFSFVQQAGDDPGRILRMGLVYAAGILASFAVLAVVMVRLDIPWGGMMQQPVYVVVMCAVVFAFALSLLGVYELRVPGLGVVENLAGGGASREGYGGAFLNGLLATALATPCVGPFLGPAMGFLIQLPPLVRGIGIMMVGLGLAFPYVLLSASPAWLRFLPKPGMWMVTFKQLMGFILIAVLVWLLWILSFLVNPLILVATVAFMAATGLAAWVLGNLSLSASRGREFATWIGVVSILVGGWFLSFHWLAGDAPWQLVAASEEQYDAATLAQAADEVLAKLGLGSDPAGTNGHAPPDWTSIPWQPWMPGLPELLSERGYTVYVDFTAKWCLTCQSNKRLVLETDEIRARLRETNVIPIVADFTNYDAAMFKVIRKHKRAGVPLNLIYAAGKPKKPILLPEVLTSGIVLKALDKAGPSQAR